MFARYRLAAIVCVLGSSLARSGSLPPLESLVDVYPPLSFNPSAYQISVLLKSETPLSAVVVAKMQSEWNDLIAPAGYRVSLRQVSDIRSLATETEPTVTVEVRGDCEVPTHMDRPRGARSDPKGPLASTATLRDAKSHIWVRPYSWVNCASLRNVLAPSLADRPLVSRQFLLGRAMGRLLAHEFYHILAQSPDHSREGVAKPGLNSVDLLSTGLRFDALAIARLKSRTAVQSDQLLIPNRPEPQLAGE